MSARQQESGTAMGAWSVAILDSGVTDETEVIHGASAFAYDYYAGDTDTDGGRTSSHGSQVAEAVELTNPALERVDMQISSNSGTQLSTTAISSALTDIGTLDTEGWSIGAINMSFSSDWSFWVSSFQSHITLLASRGIFTAASAGNGGSAGSFENASYPARLSDVISVGSHDGNGNPSWFSQNNSSTVHILADGQDMPSEGVDGTSFSAPQVAATIATAQALVESTTGDRLTFDEVVDVLQQGGGGPRSNPDPADGTTTYFLLDHSGSVTYTLSTYVDTAFSGLEYIASHSDLEAVFGRDAAAARDHLVNTGVYEGRTADFDGLEYVASYADLRAAFGTNREAATNHYLDAGRFEGRSISFDPDAYMAANPDVGAALNWDRDQATLHYLTSGADEGRPTTGAPATSATPAAVSEGVSDLPRSTATDGYVGVDQSVTGSIGYLYDRDWFETDFVAGQTVVIQARGSASGGGTLFDPELYVRDANGTFITYNWDSGAGRDAYLVDTPTVSGTHYLEVDGYWRYTGSYTLEVASASSSSLTSLGAALSSGLELSDRLATGPDDVMVALAADSRAGSDPYGLL
jgi:hypothetical protein